MLRLSTLMCLSFCAVASAAPAQTPPSSSEASQRYCAKIAPKIEPRFKLILVHQTDTDLHGVIECTLRPRSASRLRRRSRASHRSALPPGAPGPRANDRPWSSDYARVYGCRSKANRRMPCGGGAAPAELRGADGRVLAGRPVEAVTRSVQEHELWRSPTRLASRPDFWSTREPRDQAHFPAGPSHGDVAWRATIDASAQASGGSGPQRRRSNTYRAWTYAWRDATPARSSGCDVFSPFCRARQRGYPGGVYSGNSRAAVSSSHFAISPAGHTWSSPSIWPKKVAL